MSAACHISCQGSACVSNRSWKVAQLLSMLVVVGVMLGLCRLSLPCQFVLWKLRARSSRQPRHRGMPCGCVHWATKLPGVAPLYVGLSEIPIKKSTGYVPIIFLIKLTILDVYPELPQFQTHLLGPNTFKNISIHRDDPGFHPRWKSGPSPLWKTPGPTCFASVRLWKEPMWTKKNDSARWISNLRPCSRPCCTG